MVGRKCGSWESAYRLLGCSAGVAGIETGLRDFLHELQIHRTLRFAEAVHDFIFKRAGECLRFEIKRFPGFLNEELLGSLVVDVGRPLDPAVGLHAVNDRGDRVVVARHQLR